MGQVISCSRFGHLTVLVREINRETEAFDTDNVRYFANCFVKCLSTERTVKFLLWKFHWHLAYNHRVSCDTNLRYILTRKGNFYGV